MYIVYDNRVVDLEYLYSAVKIDICPLSSAYYTRIRADCELVIMLVIRMSITNLT